MVKLFDHSGVFQCGSEKNIPGFVPNSM